MSSAITGSIDRTSLTLTPLTIGQGNGISFRAVNVGRRRWRRETASSVFVAGEVETQAVLDQTDDASFVFRCRAATETALQTLITQLVAAVEQATWDLTISVGGVSWPVLTCTRADTETPFDVSHARGLTAMVAVYTTHNPTAAGPI